MDQTGPFFHFAAFWPEVVHFGLLESVSPTVTTHDGHVKLHYKEEIEARVFKDAV